MFTNAHPSPRAQEGMRMLILTPDQYVYEAAQRVLQHSNWRLCHARSLDEAKRYLNCEIAVALCAARFEDGTWRDLLDEIHEHGCPMNLVVMDRQAGDELWTQVLEGGGYDVVSIPFDQHELFRIATQAWRQWHRRHDDHSRLPAAMAMQA